MDPTPVDNRESIIADLAAGILSQAAIAEQYGVSPKTVSRIKKSAHVALGAAKPRQRKERKQRPVTPEAIQMAKERTERDLAAAFKGHAMTALDRLGEHLEPEAEPHSVQAAQVRWTLDRVIPSADAREGSKGIELLAEIVSRFQGLPGDDAKMVERSSVWEAQRVEMDRRKHVLDTEADD